MKIHRFSGFSVIERTETVRVDNSDCVASRFGNDECFLTLSDQECSSGQRTSGPYRYSLQKVFPHVVSQTVS